MKTNDNDPKAKNVCEIGERFGRWTVLAELPKGRRRQHLVRCECDTEKAVRGSVLRLGASTSCGCRQRELARTICERFLKHGDSRREKRTPEYNSWAGLRQRCLNPDNPAFKDYGGRGIKVCDRWLESFENFLADMGRKPSSRHSIDRVDSDGSYEKANCQWGTKSEQSNNRRAYGAIKIKGVCLHECGKYVAKFQGKYIGLFATAQEAGGAIARAANDNRINTATVVA